MKITISVFFALLTCIAIPSARAQKKFTINDLILFSKSKYGFVNKAGKINEYYGDIDCVSVEKKVFEFAVGCGSGGDIVSLLIKDNSVKPNSFDLFVQKGDNYFGKNLAVEKKVGELTIISENQITGFIKLCLEKNASCCGEEGEQFTMRKIQ